MNERKIAVVGLGYVGLTVAAAFGQVQSVIGFDVNKKRVEELKNGYDCNDEIASDYLKTAKIHYTINIEELKEANFYIVTVPTPVDSVKRPDFKILLQAAEMVGKQLKKGDIVVFESTVYPGATEEKCIPMLEVSSNLICGVDFSVGYSPERINPADKKHTFQTIIKIVSATDQKTLEVVDKVYSSVVTAGVHRVSCIKVAEAVKVVENTQRDLNISILNEITMILHEAGINMSEVLSAAQTKWNFLAFYPGLVGGQCMSTNSYLLAHKAQEMGFNPDVILAGRRVNEHMAKFIAHKTIKNLIHLNIPINQSRIGILGLSFKDNYPSFHDSKVIDIINEFKNYNVSIMVHDPIADYDLAKKQHGINTVSWDEFRDMDAVIVAVAHHQYLELDKNKVDEKLSQCKLVMDIRGILDPELFHGKEITYWRL